ncbi:hypothetical protein BH23ACT9_BH23ACT9_13160 [soil metagenome]
MPHHLKRLAVIIGMVALLVPSLATAEDAVTYLITDPAGDANGINGQGFGDLVPGLPADQPTPVDIAEYDMLGVRYVTLFDEIVDPESGTVTRQVTGVESRLALSAQPTATSLPAIVRLNHNVNGCAIFMQYYGGTNGQNAHDSGNVRITCEGDLTGGNPANISEGDALAIDFDTDTSEIVWAFTFGTGTAADRYFTPTATIQPTNPHVRANSGAVTAPVIDEMYNPLFRTFKVGSDVLSS